LDGVSVIVPACNEGKTVGEVLEAISRVLRQEQVPHEVILVDDGSKDDTADIARSKGVRILSNPATTGYGASLKLGLRHARHSNVVIADADGTYPVEEIPRLLEHLGEHDMVVGARTKGCPAVPLLRRPAKWTLAAVANHLVKEKIPDLNSGFRAFKKEVAQKFLRLLPDGFSFTATITLAMLSNDHPVKFFPVEYRPRRGKSKIRPIRDTASFLQLIVRVVMYFNPLRVFIPLSLLLFAAAVLVFLYSYLFTPKIMDASVAILLTAAIQVAVIGLLADLIDKRAMR